MAIIIDENESRDRRIALLLQTASQAAQIKNQREELALKKQELDPRVQAGKMANMMALMGNTDGAQKMFEYAKTGNLPSGGVQLLSQSQPQQVIPDYLAGGQNRINSQTAGISPSIMGLTGGTMKVGGTSMKFGQPGMSKYDEANLDIAKSVTTEQLKKQQETQAGLTRTLEMEDVYLNQFARSNEELNKFDPEIGRSGAGGWASRQYGKVMKNLDSLPQTKALDKLAKPIAQEIAASLEGRATDEDRKVQLDLLVNTLAGPTEENITNAANNLLLMKAKGADIKPYIDRLNNSKIPILKDIAKQVFKMKPELNSNQINLDNLFEGI